MESPFPSRPPMPAAEARRRTIYSHAVADLQAGAVDAIDAVLDRGFATRKGA